MSDLAELPRSREAVCSLVTVHDVAARAGVSIATVSRALREPQKVSDATRARVLSAVSDLGYGPNRAASGLRRGRTGIIALTVPDVRNPYFATLTHGAQSAARDHGYSLFIIDTAEQDRIEVMEVNAVRSQVDGLLLASSRVPDNDLGRVATAHPPVVLLNRRPAVAEDEVPSVTIDERAGARSVLEHLYQLGHRRIAYVGGPENAWSEARRARAIAHESRLHADVTLLSARAPSPDADGGRAIGATVLRSGATAAIAFNDMVALGMLASWAGLGARVPDDISLIGFDNTFVTSLSAPSLSSVGVDLSAFTQVAVELLFARMVGEVPVDVSSMHRSVAPTLVERESTGTVRRLQ